MIQRLYSVKDKLAGFSQPTPDVSDATAKRNFSYAINNNDAMNFSPSDYDLYYVGCFDTNKGLFAGTESGIPELIVEGSQVFNIQAK